MYYYQLLKKRRLDLNLSVQDVAIQTQLSPEYIRAIEENNLDVFSDDFSFVRYFVRAYAEAIGINWEAIAPQVDAFISSYAAARDAAITQAQKKMIDDMSSKKKTENSEKKNRRKSGKKLKSFSTIAGQISRKMNWDPKNRLSRTVVIAGVAVLAALAILSSAVDALSSHNLQNAQLARQAELKAKEEETQRLAEQLKSQKNQDGTAENVQTPAENEPQNANVRIENDSEFMNAYHVSGAVSETSPVKIDFSMIPAGSVTLYLNGEQTGSQDIDGSWSYEFTASDACTLEIEMHGYSEADTVTVNGKALSLNPDGFSDGYGIVVLYFEKNTEPDSAAESTDGDEPAASPDTEALQDTVSAEDDAGYTEDEIFYTDDSTEYEGE